MEIYPVYLMIIITVIVILRLYRNLNVENEYHIKYLIYHFIFQLLTIINLSIHFKFNKHLPLFAVACERFFCLLFFYLFLKSIYENKRARLRFIYFIPCFIIVIVNYKNSLGNILLSFIKEQIVNENILGFYSYDFIGKDDIYWLLVINLVFFTLLIYNKFYQIVKSKIVTEKIQNNIIYLFKYYTIPITITSFSTLITLGFYLINIEPTILVFFTKLIGLLTILTLVINSGVLSSLTRIKNSDESNESLKLIFQEIERLFKEDHNYTNPNYSAATISVETGIRNELIRNSIKVFSNMSVPMFINSHRIEYSIKLMNEGYLDKFSIMALAEKSGFSSQENFNRVFKLLKKNTPSELKNSIN